MINKENARVVRGLGILMMMTAVFLQITEIAFWVGIPILLVGAALTIIGRRKLRQ